MYVIVSACIPRMAGYAHTCSRVYAVLPIQSPCLANIRISFTCCRDTITGA